MDFLSVIFVHLDIIKLTCPHSLPDELMALPEPDIRETVAEDNHICLIYSFF